MHTSGSLSRCRRAVVPLLGTAAVVSGLVVQPSAASASTDAALHGALAVFPIPSGATPVQLFTGSDGRTWFVTAQSHLGEIRGAGNATLTGVTLPQGNDFGTTTPAVIAAAGPEGVWSYAATVGGSQGPNGCVITLVKSGGGMMQPRLPSSLSDFSCTGAAADRSGNLWISMVSGKFYSQCKCRVARVVEVTTNGNVSLYAPIRPGGQGLSVALGSDGAIWVLEGYDNQQLARYSASGASTPFSLASCCTWDSLLARPDGSFWLLREVLCVGLNQPFCLRVEWAVPGGTSSGRYIFPVSDPSGGSFRYRTAVAPDGSLWEAGRQSTGPTRLFRLDGNGQIDRSAGITSPAGTALQATGPITVTPAGTVWAVAATGHSAFLVRYRPAI